MNNPPAAPQPEPQEKQTVVFSQRDPDQLSRNISMTSAAPPLPHCLRARTVVVRALRNDVWAAWTGLRCVLLHAAAVVFVSLMSLVLAPEGALLAGGLLMGCVLLF